jgi:hypothetical protein
MATMQSKSLLILMKRDEEGIRPEIYSSHEEEENIDCMEEEMACHSSKPVSSNVP